MDAAPGYRELSPPIALSGLVECLWTRVCDSPGEVRVLPDGASDVIWRRGHGTTIVGPDTGPRVFARARGDLLIGIRFRPGAGGGGVGAPLDVLRDQQVDAREIDRAFALHGDLPATTVVRRLLAAAAGRRPDPIVVAAAPRVARGELGGLAREFGISERQLRRRFHAAAGYGPATLARILRFRRFLGLVDGGRRDLAGLAFDAGYADQAHLTRETARLSQLSPAALIRSRGSA